MNEPTRYNQPMLTDAQDLQTYTRVVENVKRYIRQNVDDTLSREVLASVAGFSVPHFHRVFKTCTGENISDYVRRVRLVRAGYKLRAGAVDITQVALAAGYDSHSAFCKAFKQQFRLSPSEFRRLNCFSATKILMNERLK